MSRGAPAESPAMLALVTVLQFVVDLTGRQAADAVRGRIDWKYGLGLELDDPGFDFTVLSKFRARVVAHELEVSGWAERYRARVDSWRLPASAAKREQLAIAYGADGYAPVSAVYAPFSPAWLRELPAVQALRIMLVQNYTRTTGSRGREVVKRRESLDDGGEELPPGSIRLASPHDVDVRWAAKSDDF